MKAWLSQSPGGPETLSLSEVPDPSIERDQLLIEVSACGLNFSDLLFMQGAYQVTTQHPFVPGSEVTGTVVKIGSQSEGYAIGQRVTGLADFGGAAQLAAIDAKNCIVVPDAMDPVHAAAFLFTFQTSYYALVTRGRLEREEVVLVLGAAGGVGITAVQIARALGARVVAGVSSDRKLAFCLQNGAHTGFVYSSDSAENKSLLRAALAGVGAENADIVFDPVGGSMAQLALRAAARHARYLVIGFTAGIPSIPLNLPLLRSCDILGVDVRTFALTEPEASNRNRAELLAMYERGQIVPPVSKVFDFASGREAFSALQNRAIFGKSVIRVKEEQGQRER
jgi:NADPH:quinone reductase